MELLKAMSSSNFIDVGTMRGAEADIILVQAPLHYRISCKRRNDKTQGKYKLEALVLKFTYIHREYEHLYYKKSVHFNKKKIAKILN